MNAIAPQKLQPLLDRKLACKNLKIDGECLSYTAVEHNGIGLYVFKEIARRETSIEIEILRMGTSGSLGIGVVPDNYPDNLLPGLGKSSYGYLSDGKVFRGSTFVNTSGDAWKVGDRIKCEFRKYV
ncbi:ran-binding proteins 9/10 homolog [Ruditapes philippinarum]|uniref:ran-binding proteins 9/10 homolog n=1 Tax=Ruditapes philippinarum TaxID=129788 RepID=UPI00295A8049|nr:ran-binding proteins 9/10 homolog [Ruditapes philippinarum]